MVGVNLSPTTMRVTMQLSDDELARLDQMIDAGQLRSEPATLSATDKMLDAMPPVSRNGRARANATAPSAEGGDVVAQGDDREAPASVIDTAGAGLDWDAPRTVDELLEIRRALLRGEDVTA